MIAAGPVAYLRKSVTRDPSREISREMQEASCRRMAAAYGDADRLQLYVDWGMSGGKAKRPEYLRLKAAIAAGSVTTLYSYSMSRLGRNARELLDLFETCKARGVRVMCEAEGTIGADSAMGKFVLIIMVGVAELEREQAIERSASALAARVARGDVLGQARYGKVHVKVGGVITVAPDPKRSAQPVVDAYLEGGSVLGAVRILNAAGLPSPRGCQWTTSTVARIIDTNQPGTLPRKTVTGRRTPSHSALAQLIRCPFCQTMLTRNRTRGLYYCHRGQASSTNHPRYCASERKLMEFAEGEAARLMIPDVEILADGLEAQRTALDEKRSRWIEQYGERLIDKKTRDARLGAVDRDMAALDAEASAVHLPASIDWRAGIEHPTELNSVLRVLWREIRLDNDMHPVDALWTNPAWRRAS